MALSQSGESLSIASHECGLSFEIEISIMELHICALNLWYQFDFRSKSFQKPKLALFKVFHFHKNNWII